MTLCRETKWKLLFLICSPTFRTMKPFRSLMNIFGIRTLKVKTLLRVGKVKKAVTPGKEQKPPGHETQTNDHVWVSNNRERKTVWKLGTSKNSRIICRLQSSWTFCSNTRKHFYFLNGPISFNILYTFKTLWTPTLRLNRV